MIGYMVDRARGISARLETPLPPGFEVYDPERAADDKCIDTHVLPWASPCYHGHTWWCPKVPATKMYPLALEARFRSREYIVTHPKETEEANAKYGCVTSVYFDARQEKAKALRAAGWSWGDIWADMDSKGAAW